MRQSVLFTKTSKESPREEESINSKLLIRAGFVDKLMAGVYSLLPLGFLVFKKIENVIRQEMNGVGGQEILMPSLHPRKIWEVTDRWKYEEMFKLKNRSGKDYSLGWTHEEVVTPLVKKFVNSYKDLPVFVYQIQDKFRDELRAKSGILRGVEFIMKDLYSFHLNQEDLDSYYEKVKKAYFKIFKRCGIGKETFLTLASGGAFSKYSHEFQTMTPAGEDTVYFCQKCKIGVNKEIIKEQNYHCPQCNKKNLEIRKTIEVGNIFKLKDRFTKPLDFKVKDGKGRENLVLMCCYGIGLGRLMGAVVEVHHDQKGIIWPKEISPFQVHLIALEDSRRVNGEADKIYTYLRGENIKVLYDDRRDKSVGEKFADCDLIGIPVRVVVSERTIKNKSIEIKLRKQDKTRLIKLSDFKKNVKKII